MVYESIRLQFWLNSVTMTFLSVKHLDHENFMVCALTMVFDLYKS